MKFLATVRAIRAFISHLGEGLGGRIVVVTGNRAQKPTAGMLTSTVINSALSSLVAAIGTELAARRVGVVTVSPGAVNTARYRSMVTALMNDANLDEAAAQARICEVIPDGRVADPHEVASLVSYLLSPMAAHINSSDLVIDGGEFRAP
jgi:NAD(P)-dependent dehydrogenase (short-subunit alcohol dehydrogenase family)